MAGELAVWVQIKRLFYRVKQPWRFGRQACDAQGLRPKQRGVVIGQTAGKAGAGLHRVQPQMMHAKA